jgi:hypothetical protein
MVFYAIFWGGIFNALTKWKAFQLPLIKKLPEVSRRVCLSFIILNIMPILYFAIILFILSFIQFDVTIISIIIIGIIPAFGIFGFYRLWFGIIELFPSKYYCHKGSLPNQYLFIEPTINNSHKRKKDPNRIYIGDNESGKLNVFWALGYVGVGVLVPTIYIILKSLLEPFC